MHIFSQQALHLEFMTLRDTVSLETSILQSPKSDILKILKYRNEIVTTVFIHIQNTFSQIRT